MTSTPQNKKLKKEQKPSKEDDKPIRQMSLWSHVIAGVVFCLVYLPLKGHPWSLYLAAAVAYSVFAFAIAIGNPLENLDDIFGDPRIPEYIATLFVPHAVILALIVLVVYLWMYLKQTLPPWMTHEHAGVVGWARLSYLDICSAVVLWLAGTREGIWMARKIKRRLKETEE
ncbi:MAG: hypothetical protein WDM87_01325 [Terracidiphilus sp.]